MIQFDEAKRKVTVLEVMERCGIDLSVYKTNNGVTRGPCPLHSQYVDIRYRNTQGFVIDEKGRGYQLWRCFGDCDTGGDSIAMARQLLGLDNSHVSRWFENEFSDRLKPNGRSKPNGTAQRPARKEKEEVDEEPETESKPVATPTVDVIPELQGLEPRPWPVRISETPYLTEERGLSPETIKRFGIGLATRGMMKGRVVFPVYLRDQSDDELPVAYLGRAISDDVEPRYLLPKAFPRNAVVYGLREALRDSRADAPLIVVEGCFKVADLHAKLGLTNAVATFGSSLGPGQAKQLIATGRRLVWLWDGSAIGKTCQALQQLFGQAYVTPVYLEPGVDPDDLSGDELRELLAFVL